MRLYVDYLEEEKSLSPYGSACEADKRACTGHLHGPVGCADAVLAFGI